MRKLLILAGLIAALAIPASALAVSLHEPHVGLGCSEGGTFHFVANGINGQGAGALTVDFSLGGDVTGLVSTKFNRGTNHWTIDASGTILSASATLGDKLVLSDYTCDEKKGK